jgi:hypothetical protein
VMWRLRKRDSRAYQGQTGGQDQRCEQRSQLTPPFSQRSSNFVRPERLLVFEEDVS